MLHRPGSEVTRQNKLSLKTRSRTIQIDNTGFFYLYQTHPAKSMNFRNQKIDQEDIRLNCKPEWKLLV